MAVNRREQDGPKKKLADDCFETGLKAVLIAVLTILLLPVFLLMGVLYIMSGLLLYPIIWAAWSCRGRDALVVYSNSPISHDYMTQEILKPLGRRAIGLNWSERKTWRRSLAAWAFHRFGGRREYCPVVVVIEPFRMAKTFRFFQAFKQYKRGDPSEVERLKSNVFALLKMESLKQTASNE